MANIGGNMAVRLRQITDEEWQRIDAERARAAQQQAAAEQAKREAEAKAVEADPYPELTARIAAHEAKMRADKLKAATDAIDKRVACGTSPMSEPQCTGNPAECKACEDVSGCAALEGDCPKECAGCECDYEAGYNDGYLDGLAEAKPVNVQVDLQNRSTTVVNLSLPDMPFVAVPVATYIAVAKRIQALEAFAEKIGSIRSYAMTPEGTRLGVMRHLHAAFDQLTSESA